MQTYMNDMHTLQYTHYIHDHVLYNMPLEVENREIGARARQVEVLQAFLVHGGGDGLANRELEVLPVVCYVITRRGSFYYT